MKFQLVTNNFEAIKTDILAIPVFEDIEKIPDNLSFLPQPELMLLKQIKGHDRFTAKLNHKLLIPTRNDNIPYIALVGMGKVNDWDLEKARQVAGNVIKIAQEQKVTVISFFWNNEYPIPGYPEMFMPEIVSAMIISEYQLKDFLTQEEEPIPEIKKVDLLFPGMEASEPERIQIGESLGQSVNLARRLGELPSNVVTPSSLVNEIKQFGQQFNWIVDILDRDRMQNEGLNALLAVAQGSENPPYLAIATLRNPAASKTVAMVGKGVTFDSGGISIKPSKNMEEMKYDMCGAAAVLATLQAVSLTKLPVNIIAAMPLVENMPSGKAIRPGDIVKSYSGKTIEIINTDAEGRLILADALSYVEKQYKPDVIIDLATLTGAVIVALGHMAAAVLTSNVDILETLQEASNISGEKIWQLPMWDDYKELMKSKVADVRNISNKSGAGTITAAMFLKNFVENTPWIHLDIAGTAWDMPEKSYRPANATGFGVRLLWHWLNLLTKH